MKSSGRFAVQNWWDGAEKHVEQPVARSAGRFRPLRYLLCGRWLLPLVFLCLVPLTIGATKSNDLEGLHDAQPLPPQTTPLLEKLWELRRTLVQGPETAFPAPPGYRLPWLAGLSHTVTQGPGESPTHQSLDAWDFDLTYELVLAARGGRVAMVRDSGRVGGCDAALIGEANYILIDHGDGTSALYLHIDYQGALVHEGQYVAQGRPLAYSGSTGLSCGDGRWAGPHLHFQVQRTVPGELWSETIPMTFDELEGDELSTGVSYVSANRPSSLVGLALASESLRRAARGEEILVSLSRWFLAPSGAGGEALGGMEVSASTATPPPPTATPPPVTPPPPTPTRVPPTVTPVPPTPTNDGTSWVTLKTFILSSYFMGMCSGFSGGCQLLLCPISGACSGIPVSAGGLSQGLMPFPLPAGQYTVVFSDLHGPSQVQCSGSFTVPDHNYVEIVTTDSPSCIITLTTKN
jgi:murein DD-endopeptidase MepM/ murein hydrolase activator NlpD